MNPGTLAPHKPVSPPTPLKPLISHVGTTRKDKETHEQKTLLCQVSRTEHPLVSSDARRALWYGRPRA